MRGTRSAAKSPRILPEHLERIWYQKWVDSVLFGRSGRTAAFPLLHVLRGINSVITEL